MTIYTLIVIRVHHDLCWSVCNEIQTADSVEPVLQSELVNVLSVVNQSIEIFKEKGKSNISYDSRERKDSSSLTEATSIKGSRATNCTHLDMNCLYS